MQSKGTTLYLWSPRYIHIGPKPSFTPRERIIWYLPEKVSLVLADSYAFWPLGTLLYLILKKSKDISYRREYTLFITYSCIATGRSRVPIDWITRSVKDICKQHFRNFIINTHDKYQITWTLLVHIEPQHARARARTHTHTIHAHAPCKQSSFILINDISYDPVVRVWLPAWCKIVTDLFNRKLQVSFTANYTHLGRKTKNFHDNNQTLKVNRGS